MDFIQMLERAFDVEMVDERHEDFGRTCYCVLFHLHYTKTNDAFAIEDVEVTIQGVGYGRKLIETISAYCQLHQLDLYANFVLSEAVEFWLAMGFIRDTADPMNFVRHYRAKAA